MSTNPVNPPKPQPAKDTKNQDPRPKDRLKDLDVTDRDGNLVKGGIPKQPDCDF